MTRNEDYPQGELHSPAVNAQLDDMLRQIIPLAERSTITPGGLLRAFRRNANHPAWHGAFAELREILQAYVTQELDEFDLAYELIEYAGEGPA